MIDELPEFYELQEEGEEEESDDEDESDAEPQPGNCLFTVCKRNAEGVLYLKLNFEFLSMGLGSSVSDTHQVAASPRAAVSILL